MTGYKEKKDCLGESIVGINFEYYKVFYYVARYGNITTAAKALFLSQSTVSRMIQNLEHDLETTLFVRNKKGVTLTDTGVVLYNHVSQACEHIFLGEQRVNLMKQLGEGMIKIGTTEMVMKYFLMPFLTEFRNKYPLIKMDISFQDPSKIGMALTSGQLDLAILTTPIEEDERLGVLSWMEFSDVMLAGNAYSELKEDTYSLQKLVDYPFITMRNGMSARVYLERVFLDYGAALNPVYEAESMPLVLDMLEAGFGIGCAPEFYAEEALKRKKVFEIHLEKPLPKREICAVYAKGAPGNLARDEFLRIFQE